MSYLLYDFIEYADIQALNRNSIDDRFWEVLKGKKLTLFNEISSVSLFELFKFLPSGHQPQSNLPTEKRNNFIESKRKILSDNLSQNPRMFKSVLFYWVSEWLVSQKISNENFLKIKFNESSSWKDIIRVLIISKQVKNNLPDYVQENLFCLIQKDELPSSQLCTVVEKLHQFYRIEKLFEKINGFIKEQEILLQKKITSFLSFDSAVSENISQSLNFIKKISSDSKIILQQSDESINKITEKINYLKGVLQGAEVDIQEDFIDKIDVMLKEVSLKKESLLADPNQIIRNKITETFNAIKGNATENDLKILSSEINVVATSKEPEKTAPYLSAISVIIADSSSIQSKELAFEKIDVLSSRLYRYLTKKRLFSPHDKGSAPASTDEPSGSLAGAEKGALPFSDSPPTALEHHDEKSTSDLNEEEAEPRLEEQSPPASDENTQFRSQHTIDPHPSLESPQPTEPTEIIFINNTTNEPTQESHSTPKAAAAAPTETLPSTEPVKEKTVQEKNPKPINEINPTAQLAGRFLREQRFDEAYWLSFSAAEGVLPSSWLFEVLSLGYTFQPSFSDTEKRLAELYAQKQAEEFSQHPLTGLLLFVSLVRPVLLSPQIVPYPLLEWLSVSRLAPELGGLVQYLMEFSLRNHPLSETLFSRFPSVLEQEAKERSLRDEALRWLSLEAPGYETKYYSAVNVWNLWVTEGGELYHFLQDCFEDRLSVGDIKKRVRELKNTDLKVWVNQTDKKLERPSKKPIEGRALDWIEGNLKAALEYAERWVQVKASRAPEDQVPEGERTELERLRQFAIQLVPQLKNAEATSPSLQQDALFLLGLFLETFLDTKTIPLKKRERDPLREREDLLLFCPEIERSQLGSQSERDALHRAIVRHVDAPLHIKDAIFRQAQAGHFQEAKRLLSLAPESERPSLEEELSDEMARRLKLTKNQVKLRTEALERAYTQNLLSEEKRLQLEARLKSCQQWLEDSPDDLPELRQELEDVEKELREIEEAAFSKLEQRYKALRSYSGQKSKDWTDEIDGAFANATKNRDVTLFNELLAQLGAWADGGRYPQELLVNELQTQSLFQAFFEEAPALYDAILNIDAFAKRLQSPTGALPIHGARTGESRLQAAQRFSGWVELQKARRAFLSEYLLSGYFFELLRWLGLPLGFVDSLKASAHEGPPNNWYHIKLPLSADPKAPIPLFGSMAQRQYEIVLVWGNTEPESMARWLDNHKLSERPLIVFYFNRLHPNARRRYIHVFRQHRICALLIDDCLMAWLCSKEVDPFEAMFQVALPGGFDIPYKPEMAGNAPPEIFYGREEMVETLWKPEGSCIVYGGRQLGKSALLQHVRRTYHAPSAKEYVLYEGIKSESSIWAPLRRLLVREDLLENRTNEDPDTLIKHLYQLTKPGGQVRRMVLLFDESDNFLENDRARRFQEIDRLRDLMIGTNHQVKFVFAGLHSVQRFQHIPNQPFAHFGDPLCVGPLPPQAASDLIRRPLQALGYQFEPGSIVYRILAHTNYHPGLIQLFCHALVYYLLEKKAVSVERTPPFLIQEQSVEEVYQQVKLREKMRNRFEWTLDLDPSYRVLAYTFAYLELEGGFEERRSRNMGLTPLEILPWVGDAWPKRFKGCNEDELRGLLDEMAGLGLLVSSGGHNYRLRSMNVLQLIGGEKEVQAQLNRFADAPYDPTPVPQVLHRTLSNPEHGISPLTLYQESKIIARERGIDVVVGSEALGLSKVQAAIEDLLATGQRKSVLKVLEPSSIAKEALDNIRTTYQASRTKEGLHFLIKGDDLSPHKLLELMKLASEWLESLSSQKVYVRFLFLLAPDTLWSLYEKDLFRDINTIPELCIHHLRRWKATSLSHWFHDAERPAPGMDYIAACIEKTGGWPFLLEPLLHQLRVGKEPEINSLPMDTKKLPALSGLGLVLKAEQRILEFGDKISSEEELGKLNDKEAERLLEFFFSIDLLIGTNRSFSIEPCLLDSLLRGQS